MKFKSRPVKIEQESTTATAATTELSNAEPAAAPAVASALKNGELLCQKLLSKSRL